MVGGTAAPRSRYNFLGPRKTSRHFNVYSGLAGLFFSPGTSDYCGLNEEENVCESISPGIARNIIEKVSGWLKHSILTGASE